MKTIRGSAGLTLIELMIVVAIISILAAVAIPAYQNYVIRTQVAEGLQLATSAKSASWEYLSIHGTLPANNGEAGLQLPALIRGRYVSSITITEGKIEIRYGEQAASILQGRAIELRPLVTSGSVSWSCRSAEIAPRYRPLACRDD